MEIGRKILSALSYARWGSLKYCPLARPTLISGVRRPVKYRIGMRFKDKPAKLPFYPIYVSSLFIPNDIVSLFQSAVLPWKLLGRGPHLFSRVFIDDLWLAPRAHSARRGDWARKRQDKYLIICQPKFWGQYTCGQNTYDATSPVA